MRQAGSSNETLDATLHRSASPFVLNCLALAANERDWRKRGKWRRVRNTTRVEKNADKNGESQWTYNNTIIFVWMLKLWFITWDKPVRTEIRRAISVRNEPINTREQSTGILNDDDANSDDHVSSPGPVNAIKSRHARAN